ncbi:MAG: hypothetical protein N2447_02090 [Thermoanaerobaculum sp.]|nr:hypothetical protein [Thermoanaerobaculum sp.]
MPSFEVSHARQTLLQRGYLQPPSPPPPLSQRRWWVGFTLAFALVGALVAAGTGAGGLWGFLLLTAALTPALGVVVAGCWWGVRHLARVLLKWGARPRMVLLACALLAGLAVVVFLLGLVGEAGWTVAGWLGVGAGAVLAGLVGAWVFTHLAWQLRVPAPNFSPKPLVVFCLTAAVGGGASFSLPRGAEHGAAVVPPKLPRPQERVAVVAVDSLSREDLQAAAQLLGGTLARAQRWVWGAVEPGGARFPGEFWTTVACGASPSHHGVTVLEETRPFGLSFGVALSPWGERLVAIPWGVVGLAPKVARPTLQRHLPTFWEMAATAGYPVTVVGWWGSWPVRLFSGQVVSERAILSGAVTSDAVTPGFSGLVQQAWSASAVPAQRATQVALAAVEWAAQRGGPQLLVVQFLALDLQGRQGHLPPLALAARQLPHLSALGQLLERLEAGGFTVLLVGAGWQGGTWFWAYSGATGGPGPGLSPEVLAPAVLRVLGLPVASHHPLPPAPPFGVSAVARVAYPPPPPVVEVPDARSVRVQREVLRSLGYLR